MLVGVDGFTYHRHFGHTFHLLEAAGDRWTALQALDHAIALGAEGFSVESFMISAFPDRAGPRVTELRARAEQAGVRLDWAWGHPEGFASGQNPRAMADLLYHVEMAEMAGARVLRVCTGGPITRARHWGYMRDRLIPLLVRAAEHAWAAGIELAVENHGDLLADELAELVSLIGHPGLGVCLDTGNNLRLLEDPELVISTLVPYAKVVHLKDIATYRGSPKDFEFWRSAPTGRGLIDIPQTLRQLRDHDFAGLLAVQIDFLHPGMGSDPVDALAESLAATRRLVAELG